MGSTAAVLLSIAGAVTVSLAALLVAISYLYKLHRIEREREALARTKPRGKVAVTLILPLTGAMPGLSRLIRDLEQQTLQPRRLLLAVESTQDPAYRAARDAALRTRLPIEIEVAGAARTSAQKCWNLIAALNRLDTADDVVVLLDGDIRPGPHWLDTVVRPLTTDLCDVSTGYRWHRIDRHAFGAHVIAAIDRSIALLPRPAASRIAWGGTLALKARTVALLRLEQVLGSTVSDDCAIGEHAARLGLRIRTDRSLLVPTPITSALGPALRFARRQYHIMRIHRPWLYLLALASMGARGAVWATIVAGLIHQWSETPALLAAGAALIGLRIGAYWGQQRIARHLGIGDTPSVAALQVALCLALPVVDLLHLGVTLAALHPTFHWAHIRYKVSSPTRVEVVSRSGWSAAS